MTEILLIGFSITLLFIAISNRLKGFTKLLAFQGILLFVIAFLELTEINILNLIFILLETIIFKAIAIPLFLQYLIRRNRITRETEPYVSYFFSIIMVTIFILGSFLLVHQLKGFWFSPFYLVVALATIFTGMYIIITRKKIITHVMGYMVIENGVFLLSLAVGNKMPMLVNTGILLDIFISVLILGIFATRIGDVFEESSVEHLESLKD